MSGFPFYPIAAIAGLIHVLSFILAVTVEAIWNKGGWMRTWGKVAALFRLFTVQRSEVKFRVSWVLIMVSRVALIIVPLSFVLALLTHPT